MGGYGSGRQKGGSGARLDDGLRLDINKLFRDRLIGLNMWKSGQLTWSIVETGEHVASVGYEINTLRPDDMWLRLHYTQTSCFSDSPNKRDYKIRLIASRPYYGGKRLWFICPITGQKASVMYSSGSSRWFASRHAYRAGYHSQSKGLIDRAIDKAWRLKDKLGGEHYYIRQKGVHTRTHERLMEKILEQEEITDNMLAVYLSHADALCSKSC